jgi:predicted nucleic-acid-binding protein
MLAVDTNIIVRYVTGDEPRQAARARAIIERQTVFVATTVLLETEWVLRSAYGFEPSQVLDALTAFCGLPSISLENAGRIATALSWMRAGLDFADALHLAAAEDCDAFASFDSEFVKRARRAGARAQSV